MSDRSTSRRDRVFFPALFVLLWSSGYIGSKLGVPYAEPYTFISLRYSLVLLILLPVTLLMRAPWPRSPREAVHIAIAGLLIQAVYLGGCVYALRLGLPAGCSACWSACSPCSPPPAPACCLANACCRASGSAWRSASPAPCWSCATSSAKASPCQ